LNFILLENGTIITRRLVSKKITMQTNKIMQTILTGAITIISATSNAQQGPTADERIVNPSSEIRPFHVHFSDAALADLRRRVLATNWPDRELVGDLSQGLQLGTMKKLAHYWATEYDWRKIEATLNALPQFITNIDGVDIHFIHVRSRHTNALPIIITHGWPGSIIEQLKVIGPLTDPTAYGGKAEDAFDVVIPSLPGHGFSGKPTELGWDPVRIARAWIILMKRLGYTRYVAQGGDWGDAVTEQMAVIAPPELLGIHTNMAATLPPEVSKALATGGPAPEGLSTPDEQHAWDQLDNFWKHGLGYATEMANRPQTLYGLEDSPIGLAAWMLDHDSKSTELITRVFDGQTEGLTREDVVNNITLYWLTGTAVSSARLYWENKLAFFDIKHITIPVAVSAFPDEIYQVPRTWAEKAFPHLIHYNKLAKGGHFAAWEQPQVFCDEIRDSFRSLR
jgi:pimeloyl-ACP methyl ester carboxylesterase